MGVPLKVDMLELPKLQPPPELVCCQNEGKLVHIVDQCTSPYIILIYPEFLRKAKFLI